MASKFIYALGFFDGVHLGHRALLENACALAQQLGCIPGAVTFDPHPATLLGATPALINTLSDRLFLLKRFGMEQVLTFPFDAQMKNLPWQDFLAGIPSAAGFVCGSDFRFGARGAGNAQSLSRWCRERGLPCAIVPQQEMDGRRISSSHIRTLLQAGDMEKANAFLGHPHVLTGKVVSGRKLGRTLGIPTANLALPPELAVPRLGVYASLARFDGKAHPAVTNIGCRPTVGGHHITVESWLLDFDGDLYEKTVTVEFHRFLRPEQKFPSLEALQAEIRKNGEESRNFFEKS